jgi:hypothetical protein
MSGYLQYSTYGEDEPLKQSQQGQQSQQQSQQSQQAQQAKRTLRTNQRTLRSKQPRLVNPRQMQPMQPMQQAQPPAQSQPQSQAMQSLIQKIHSNSNSNSNGSDSESESDTDDTHMQMQQQFQTAPVPNRNRFAAANSADLNAGLNPAPAKEGFSLQDVNALANQYKQYMPSVFQASTQENKDILLQKLDHIISLLEDQRDEKTGHVTEELVLYCFLGVFIIFIVDSFARAGKYVR